MADGSDTSQQSDDTSLQDVINGGAYSAGQNIAAGLGAPNGIANLDLSNAGASFVQGALAQVTPYLPWVLIGVVVLAVAMRR